MANNITELEKTIQKYMDNALLNTANIITSKLVEFINLDYYEVYTPKDYGRTNQFLDSPKFQMLAHNIAEIFVDTNSMNYKNASGDYVARLAMQGFHGNESIFVAGFYWEDFLSWCNENVLDIYIIELRKLGINVD